MNAFTKGCCRFNSPAFGALGFTCIPSALPQVWGFVIQVWVFSSDRVLGYHFFHFSGGSNCPRMIQFINQTVVFSSSLSPSNTYCVVVCYSSSCLYINSCALTISAVIDLASSCTLLQTYVVLERTKKDVWSWIPDRRRSGGKILSHLEVTQTEKRHSPP